MLAASAHRSPLAESVSPAPGAAHADPRLAAGPAPARGLGGLKRWAWHGARSLQRTLRGLLLLVLIVDLVALPLHAGLHGLGEPNLAGHGWHAGQDRLHIEPDSGHPNAELLDHSALRPASSIRPVTSTAADGSRPGADDPGSATAAAKAMAWLALLGGLAALVLAGQPCSAGGARRQPAASAGRRRPWRGLCPPRQAPPRA